MSYLMTVTATTPTQEQNYYSRDCQVLNHQEAKLRLQNLKPGTEEHRKLQDALIKTAGIVEISLSSNTYKVNTALRGDQLLGGFGTSEHVAIGKEVKLKGLLSDDTSLLQKGNTLIQFQHIVALAGDFYDVAGEAISLLGGTVEQKTERFKKAFGTLAQEGNEEEVRKVLLIIENECKAVEHSSLPHHCYNIMIRKNSATINELLDYDNSDHFSTNAEEAYYIGHAWALQKAKHARKQRDRIQAMKELKEAYAVDAFACHFLADLFSAGHNRNQRGKLQTFLLLQLKFPEDRVKKLAGILTGAQHEKDSNEGLNVSNQKGEQWRAYGDGCFFATKNAENRKKVITALQQSVDEVYDAYDFPESMSSAVHQLIPYTTSFNPWPFYSVEGTVLFLYQGIEKIEIKTQPDYLDKGLIQALNYLPEEYKSIVETFNPNFSSHWADSVILQIERLTVIIWSMVGVATYHRNKQKYQNLLDTLKTSSEKCVEIAESLQKSSFELEDQPLDKTICLLRELNTLILNTEMSLHSYEISRDVPNNERFSQIKEELWVTQLKIASIFRRKKSSVVGGWKTSSSENKINVTLQFRQVLKYQVQLFCTYMILLIVMNEDEGDLEVLQAQVLAFESDLLNQIKANEKHIDKALICENQNYMILQLEKSREKHQFLKSVIK